MTGLEDLLREAVAEALHEVIQKCGGKWCLYTRHKQKNGKRKLLGKHPSKSSAEDQEKAIHSHGG